MAESVQIITTQFKTDTSGLDKAAKSLGLTTDEATRLEKAFNEAGISMDILTKKAGEVGKSAEGFKSLKQQLKEARNEATLLAQKFGENSKEALNATKRVAQLTEELDDFNQRVKALNPEAKFNAVSQSLQGVLGGLQGVTGALQLFGSESEQVQKIAQKLQGALNLAQGINSVIGLKDAFANLRVVLGLTTAAQTAAAAATTATTVATEGATVATGAATVATRGFTAALVANPITAVAVALSALVGGILLYNSATEDSTELTKEQTEALKEQEKAQKDLADRYAATGKAIEQQIEDQRIKTALALGKIDDLQAKLQQNELNRRRALEESEFSGDVTRIARINKLYNLIEEGLKAEAAAKQKVELINDKFYGKELKYLESKKDLSREIIFLNQLIGKELEKAEPIAIKNAASTAELNQKLFDQFDQRLELSFALAQQSAGFISDLSAQSSETQRRNLEKQKADGIITEEQYQEKLKKIEVDAAKRQKELSIFSATVAFAEALVKALTTPNPPAALTLAAVVGGLNLARIIATPIPKFKHGTLNVGGGNMDSDGGSLAMVHPGEAIIPQDRNKLYAPALKAIYHKQISPREINAFVQNKLNGNIENRVTADVDTYGLARAMARNKGVQIENARVVGKAIASEIAQRINRRQMI